MMKNLLLLLAATATVGVAQAQTVLGTAQYKGYSKYIKAVDEYVPAPGQFVNALPAYEDGDDAAAMAAKCTAAIADDKGQFVTLGAYGGYITFHFDHSVANVKGQRDIYIKGNAFANNSEPGVVMVSKDVNGNGLPDDPWYEIAGSAETDRPGEVVYGYEVTYTKDAMNAVPWTDNKGGSGVVERIGIHKQEYFPLWLDSPLKFTGTLLPKNAVNSGSDERPYWNLKSYSYGYVDNLPNSDIEGCSIDLSWAVDADRSPVDLDAVDFVRVYCGENQSVGALGETSTEIAGAEDLHLEASVDAQETASVATFENISLADESHYMFKPADAENMEYYEGAITSGRYKFSATYMDYYGYDMWTGFVVANYTDNVYAALDDQFKNAKGGGHKSANYAICYASGPCTVDVQAGEQGAVVSGFYVNNSAWVADAILHGDGMSGDGYTGTDGFRTGDWFKLTLTATKADNSTVTKDVYLADYRSESEADHYYIADWTWVDLSDLGAVKSIAFSLSSTRNGQWGMTTPAYFCIDDFGGVNDGSTNGIAHPAVSGGKAPVAKSRFTVDGQHIAAPQRGVNIIRMSDGSIRKVLVK